jgi:hypothetical protein
MHLLLLRITWEFLAPPCHLCLFQRVQELGFDEKILDAILLVLVFFFRAGGINNRAGDCMHCVPETLCCHSTGVASCGSHACNGWIFNDRSGVKV